MSLKARYPFPWVYIAEDGVVWGADEPSDVGPVSVIVATANDHEVGRLIAAAPALAEALAGLIEWFDSPDPHEQWDIDKMLYDARNLLAAAGWPEGGE